MPILYSYDLDSLSLGAGIMHSKDSPAAFPAIIDGNHSAGLVHHIAITDKIAATVIPITENPYLIAGGKHFLKTLVFAFFAA